MAAVQSSCYPRENVWRAVSFSTAGKDRESLSRLGEEMELWGWPVLMLLRGRVIMRDGQLIGDTAGEYLWRTAK